MGKSFRILPALLLLSVSVTQIEAAQVVISWSWKQENKISVWTPAPGKTFIVATATISVSGYSDFTNPFYFQLETGSGLHQHSMTTYSLADHLTADTLPDGSSRIGSLTFEIP